MALTCSIQRCPGTYETKQVTHTVKHEGELGVIDHVPAEVCSICGDVLFSAETIRGLEQMLDDQERSELLRCTPSDIARCIQDGMRSV